MSKLIQRLKGLFHKNTSPRSPYTGSIPNRSNTVNPSNTITKPSYQIDEDDDDDDDSYKAYNITEQTRLRDVPKETNRSQYSSQNGNPYLSTETSGAVRSPMGTTISSLSNISANTNTSPSLRPGPPFSPQPINNNLSSSTGFLNNSNINRIVSNSPAVNLTQPTANPPASQGFPPGVNSNQPPLPGIPPVSNPNLPTSNPPVNNSSTGIPGFLFASKTNTAPSPSTPVNNSQVPLSILQPRNNGNQTLPSLISGNPTVSPSSVPPPLLMQHPPVANSSNLGHNTTSSNRPNNEEDNVSRLELDYPIENVLIDSNIPSSVAIKVNETVEHDRLGNAYHIHRYTFEPSVQHLSFGDNEHIDRRLISNPLRMGTRHIREIHTDHEGSEYEEPIRSHRSKGHHRRHRRNSQTSLDRYVKNITHEPSNIIINAQSQNDVQRILSNILMPTNVSTAPVSLDNSYFPGPVFYYTACALPNDPMRPH